MPKSSSSRRALLAGACTALVAAFPSTASAQSPAFGKCERPPGAACGEVSVPLDHSGRVPGRIGLRTAILPATGNRTGSLIILTGGPGQPAVPIAADLARQLRPVRATHDLVFVDQRGTGGSGAVECPSRTTQANVRRCADALGERRPFYTTRETALDIEDVRAFLGIEKVSLYGVSYGATVAGEYVRRFPARTASVVLDSPDRVNGSDVTNVLRQLGLPRVLREICFPPSCRDFLSEPTAALRTLVQRLQRRPLRGRAVLPSGRTQAARVTVDDVYNLILSSDVDPILRSELPAAIASGVLGDPAPLLRLLVASTRAAEQEQEDPGAVNPARFLATSCVEGNLPWAPDSPIEGREQALERSLAATPREAFAPFGPATVIRNSVATACLVWPSTPKPEGVANQGPDVPVLVIAGREDLRTPLEDARRTAAQFPRSRVLAVPGVGHSVLASDPTECTITGIAAFLGGQEVANCERLARRSIIRAPFIPESLGDLRAEPGLPRAIGRVATAARATLQEFNRLAFNAGQPSGSDGQRLVIPGLRGGTATLTRRSVTLRRFELIRGVRISGTSGTRSGRLTLTAPGGITGVLTTGRGDTVRGTIGGRRVSFEFE